MVGKSWRCIARRWSERGGAAKRFNHGSHGYTRMGGGSRLAKSSMAKLWAVELLVTTNFTPINTKRGAAQGSAWSSQAGAAFSNPFTSELARDCKNTSLTRFTSSPAFRVLREMKKLPRIGFQKKSGARPACWDGGFF